MLQQRLRVENGGDGRWHSPDRDLAYCWPSLARAAMEGLEPGAWKPWLADYLVYSGVTADDLEAAAKAYAEFFRHCTDPGVKTPREALEKAGWFRVKEAAQAAVCMKMGQVATCAFFPAIRDVTPLGESPPLDMAALYRSALSAGRAVRPPSRAARLLAGLRDLLWRPRTTPPAPPRS